MPPACHWRGLLVGALAAAAGEQQDGDGGDANLHLTLPPKEASPLLARTPANRHMKAMAITIRTSLEEPETGQAFIPHRPERPAKAEGGKAFRLVSDYQPAGDQPQAIAELVEQSARARRPRCCSASPARARPSPWPR